MSNDPALPRAEDGLANIAAARRVFDDLLARAPADVAAEMNALLEESRYTEVTDFASLCDGCGCCCSFLDVYDQVVFRELDRGDGRCLHLDPETRRCRIYAERPLQCRVDDCFRASGLDQRMSRPAYYAATLMQCWLLRHLVRTATADEKTTPCPPT